MKMTGKNIWKMKWQNRRQRKQVNLESVTITDIEDHKLRTFDELNHDLNNLLKFAANTNERKHAGNNFQYHYQFKNLLKCKRQDGKTIYDIYNDKQQWDKLIVQTKKRSWPRPSAASKIFECYRANLGAIVMFKATTAKYLYKKYNATSVLDPTAGWGGRMLGAWALDIDYIGIDTNINMKPAYDNMIDFLNNRSKNEFFDFKQSNLQMIWQSALDVDFSQLNYDFVLTSPPYVNLELYEHMEPWKSDQHFYTKFFIPLWQKCIDNIKANGHICFNISPKMYEQAIKHGLKPCDYEEDLLQQMGPKKGKKKQDKIYIWKERVKQFVEESA